MFLGLLYQGMGKVMARLEANRKVTTQTSGPIWFLQLWLQAFFHKDFFGHVLISTETAHLALGVHLLKQVKKPPSLEKILMSILRPTIEHSDYCLYDRHVLLDAFPLWVDPEVRYPFGETDAPEVAQYPSWRHSCDSIVKPRYLVTGCRQDGHRRIVTAEVYLPHMLARQFSCPHAIPDVITGDLIPAMNEQGHLTLSAVPGYGHMVTTYIRLNSYIPFRRYPSMVRKAADWWGVHHSTFHEVATYLAMLGPKQAETKTMAPSYEDAHKAFQRKCKKAAEQSRSDNLKARSFSP